MAKRKEKKICRSSNAGLTKQSPQREEKMPSDLRYPHLEEISRGSLLVRPGKSMETPIVPRESAGSEGGGEANLENIIGGQGRRSTWSGRG